MHCPNCRHILTKVNLSGIEVEHCNNCGSTLFEANEINRITSKDAERLSMMKQTDVISAAEKISPRDGNPLTRIEGESIPQHVTILHSESTGETFAFPDDLVEFKKAQGAKVEYFKAWRIPMPQVRNILVLGLALFATVSFAYIASTMRAPTSQSIRAQELCVDGVGTVDIGDSIMVSCTTSLDLSCGVQAECANGESVQLTCSNNTYFGTVSELCTSVRFFYEDEDGRVETIWKSLD